MPSAEQIIDFLKWLGPVGAISVLFNAALLYGYKYILKYFRDQDDKKRADVKEAFGIVQQCAGEVAHSLNELKFVMSGRGYDVTDHTGHSQPKRQAPTRKFTVGSG